MTGAASDLVIEQKVPTGYHVVRHVQPGKRFEVLVHGVQRFDGYGYPGGCSCRMGRAWRRRRSPVMARTTIVMVWGTRRLPHSWRHRSRHSRLHRVPRLR